MQTVTEAGPPADPGSPTLRGDPRALAEHVAVGLAALCWLWVTRSSGGLHDQRTGWLSLALIPAVVATRPWRHVAPALLLLVIATGVGAAIVLTVTPMGWTQADSPAGQLTGCVALLVTAAYARTQTRRTVTVGVLLLALLWQFYEAWLPWWGSGDPNHLMVGTFYWHNQLGAWMLGTGLAAGAVAVLGPRDLRLPALIVTPFADVAVVLSTSRASLGLLVVGHLALLVLAALSAGRRTALLRAVALPLAAAALLWGLTTPVFFPTAHFSGPAVTQTTSEPDAGVAGSRGTDTVGQSGNQRVEWTKAALESWLHEPLTGDGFGSFVYTSDARLPDGLVRTIYVHNAPAEALSSGGLLFGLPLLALLGVVAVRSLQRVWTTARRGGDGLRSGAALASLALLAHSCVDFDWHYAALVILFGVVGGVVLARDDESATKRSPAMLPFAALLVAVLALASLGSFVEHRGRSRQVVREPHAVEQLLAAQLGSLYDARLAHAALHAAIRTTPSAPDELAVSRSLGQQVLARSEREARLQPADRATRAELTALLGNAQAAQQAMQDLVERYGGEDPGLYAAYAQVSYLAGGYAHVRPLVAQAVQRSTDTGTAWLLVRTMEQLDLGHPTELTICAYASAQQRFGGSPFEIPALSPPGPEACQG